MSNKIECFSYKGGCGVREHTVRVSRNLKEKLAWAIDKWLCVNSNKMLFKNNYATKKLKNKAILNFKKLYTLLCDP